MSVPPERLIVPLLANANGLPVAPNDIVELPRTVIVPALVAPVLSTNNVPFVASVWPKFNSAPLIVPEPMMVPVLVRLPDNSVALFIAIVPELLTVPPTAPLVTTSVALLVSTPKFCNCPATVSVPLVESTNPLPASINPLEISPPPLTVAMCPALVRLCATTVPPIRLIVPLLANPNGLPVAPNDIVELPRTVIVPALVAPALSTNSVPLVASVWPKFNSAPPIVP